MLLALSQHLSHGRRPLHPASVLEEILAIVSLRFQTDGGDLTVRGKKKVTGEEAMPKNQIGVVEMQAGGVEDLMTEKLGIEIEVLEADPLEEVTVINPGLELMKLRHGENNFIACCFNLLTTI